MQLVEEFNQELFFRLKKLLSVLKLLATALRDENREAFYKETKIKITNGKDLSGLSKKARKHHEFDQAEEDKFFAYHLYDFYLGKKGIIEIKPYLIIPKDEKGDVIPEPSSDDVLRQILYTIKNFGQYVEIVDNYNRRATASILKKDAWLVTDEEASEHYSSAADHQKNQIYLKPKGLFELFQWYSDFIDWDERKHEEDEEENPK
ncbi:MAG: hypothetical protein WCW87_02330 [Candidatus Paceibacterota bacterium]